MSPETAALLELAEGLRARGVKIYDDRADKGALLEFFPSPTQTTEADVRALAQVAEPMCACGHPVAMHMNGLCSEMGCSGEKCGEVKK